MNKEFYMMIPNDYIFMEDSDLWLVSRDGNDLIKGNLLTEECEYIASIPPYESGTYGAYRGNSLCTKYRDHILCLPDLGNCIWVYDLTGRHFTKIAVENPNSVRLGFSWCHIMCGTLWAWSGGLKSLLEIDLEQMKIRSYHSFADSADEAFAYQVFVLEETFYAFSAEKKILYKYSLLSGRTDTYKIPEIGEGIFTICYNGDAIWFSGIEECLYRWDMNNGDLIRLDIFPKDFQVFQIASDDRRPLFYKSLCQNGYIWFVPFNVPGTLCNSILAVDLNTYKMKAVKLGNERDNGQGAYTFEYVKDGRWIGFFYSKNDFISEIDMTNFEIKQKRMKFSFDNYVKLFRQHVFHNSYTEKTCVDLEAFINL